MTARAVAAGGVDDQLVVRRIDVDSDHRVVVRLEGMLVEQTAGIVGDVLGRLGSNALNRIVVDLAEVPLVDAAAIDVLLACRAGFALVGGAFTVTEASPSVRAALHAAGASALLGGLGAATG